MKDSKNKKIIITTVILCLCIFVVSLYCFIPREKTEKVVDIFTISFDTGGGTKIAAIEVGDNGEIILPENPTREGYIFVGWTYNGEPYDFSQGITKDMTLTAEWKKIEEDKNYYVVVFNTDGGTTIANQVLEEGEIPTRPQDPTKDGFMFVEWRVDGEIYDFSSPLMGDITVVAIYNQVEQPDDNGNGNGGNSGGGNNSKKTYTVTFDNRGGSGCGAQRVVEGNSATYCTPTRAGYTFQGWSTSASSMSIVSAGTISGSKVTGNVTYYAVWTPLIYNIKVYDVNGGTCKTLQKSYGSSIAIGELSGCNTTVAIPKYFKHWSTSLGGGAYSFGSAVTNEFSLYAVTGEHTYTVSCTLVGDAITMKTCQLTFKMDETTITVSNIVLWQGDMSEAGGYNIDKGQFDDASYIEALYSGNRIRFTKR